MQNEFEKKVQQQLEQFALKPNDAVWANVDARIRKDKRRRRAFFYWTAAVILLTVGLGGYFYITPATNEQRVASEKQPEKLVKDQKAPDELQEREGVRDSNVRDNKDNGKDLNVSKTSEGSENFIAKRKDVKARNRSNSLIRISYGENKAPAISEITVAKKNRSINSKYDNKVFIDNDARNKPVVPNKEETVLNKADVKEIPLHRHYKITEEKINSEPKKEVIELTSSTKEKADKANIKVASTSDKKTKFGVTLVGGISNNVTSFPVFSEEKALVYAPNSAAPNSPAAAPLPVKDQFKSAASFGIGGFAQHSISKKLNITTGLDYHYYSINMKVGARIDSSAMFREAALNTNTAVASFYRTGQSSSYKNRFHLIQIPLNLQWQLNRNELKPFHLFAGITPSFIIGANALHYNLQQGLYYKENKQYKRMQLLGQGGFMITVANTSNLRFQLGPILQYGITNLTKPAVKTNEHLIFLGLKTNVIIK